jgi:TP901 family phage tail tape measure protein
MSSMGLGITVSAQDLASQGFAAVSKSFTGMVSVFSAQAAIGAGAALLISGLLALKAAFNLAQIAGRFEQTMVSVGAISRATAEEMGLLRDAAIQAGIATQFSPREAAEGLQSLAAAGQNARASIETLRPVLDLAAGSLGQLGVAQAAEAVVGTLNAYGESADQAASVTDRLLRITQLSNFQTRDFQVGLSRAAATGAQYGTELNDVLITMGLLRNANIEASVASTSLREAMRRVMTDQGSLQRLQRLGVRSFDEQTGAARSALDVMQDGADATRAMTDEERSATVSRIFGVRGLLAFNAVAQANNEIVREGERITLRGRDAIANLREEMSQAEGTAETFREALLSTFRGQMTLLAGTVETLQTVIGETFGDVFRPIMLGVTDTLNAFIRVWTSVPRALRTAIGVITLLVSAFSIFAGAVLLITGLVAILVVTMGSLLLVVGAVAAGIIVAMVPVIAAWGLLAAGAFAVRRAYEQNFGGLADFINAWASQIELTWRAVTEIFTGRALSNELRDELLRAENEGVLRFVGQVQAGFQRAQEYWTGFTNAVGEAWTQTEPVWTELRAAITTLFEEIEKAFGPASDLMQAGNRLPTDKFQEFGKTMGGDVGRGIKIVVEGLVEVTRLMILIARAYNFIKPALDDMGAAFGMIGSALVFIAEAAEWVFDTLYRIQRMFSIILPVIDLFRGAGLGEALTGEFEAREGGHLSALGRVLGITGDTSETARVQADQVVAMERDRRQQEQTEQADLAAFGGRGALSPDLEEFILAQRREERGQGTTAEGRPLTINVNVDGETLASRNVSATEQRGAEMGQSVLPDDF